MRKILLLAALVAASSYAQTFTDVRQIVMRRFGSCFTTDTSRQFVAIPLAMFNSNVTRSQAECVILDMTGLQLDQSTRPWTLRLVPPVPTNIGPTFVDQETPNGATDGANTSFTLVDAPSPQDSLLLFRDGLLMTRCKTLPQATAGLCDYTLTGNQVVYQDKAQPVSGAVHTASYRR